MNKKTDIAKFTHVDYKTARLGPHKKVLKNEQKCSIKRQGWAPPKSYLEPFYRGVHPCPFIVGKCKGHIYIYIFVFQKSNDHAHAWKDLFRQVLAQDDAGFEGRAAVADASPKRVALFAHGTVRRWQAPRFQIERCRRGLRCGCHCHWGCCCFCCCCWPLRLPLSKCKFRSFTLEALRPPRDINVLNFTPSPCGPGSSRSDASISKTLRLPPPKYNIRAFNLQPLRLLFSKFKIP